MDEPSFMLSKTIGENAYEIEAYFMDDNIRIVLTREYEKDGKVKRVVQSIVFPVEIIKLLYDELYLSEHDSRNVTHEIDQINKYLEDNFDLIIKLSIDRIESKAEVVRHISECTDGFNIDEKFLAVIRTLAISYMCSRLSI